VGGGGGYPSCLGRREAQMAKSFVASRGAEAIPSGKARFFLGGRVWVGERNGVTTRKKVWYIGGREWLGLGKKTKKGRRKEKRYKKKLK